jgi:hypothetical protein
MIANHIHDALGQVRRLQSLILEKRKFTGFSGTARMLGGSIALLGCALMSFFRNQFAVQLAGWVCFLIIALLLNYGALMLWFVQLPKHQRNLQSIVPAFEAVPPLAVGALLSAALLLRGEPNLLFGAWMCLYGLANTAYRTSLPKAIWYLGLYYLACGTVFLMLPGETFFNPLPAGIVFLIGEWIGGVIFHRQKIEAMESSE